MSENLAAIVIPTLATITVFILGYLFNAIIECSKEQTRLRTIREDVFSWIGIIKMPLEKDIESLEQLSKLCTEDKCLQQPGMEWRPLMGAKIERIVDNVVMEAFLERGSTDQRRRENQQNVFNLVSQSRFLTEIEDDVKKKYEDFSRRSEKMMDEWNAQYIKMMDYINNAVNYGLMPNEPFCKELINLIHSHENAIRAHPQNFEIVYETFVSPILRSVHKSHSEYIALERMAFYAKVIYDQWKALRVGYAQVFGDIGERMSNSLRIIEETENKLK